MSSPGQMPQGCACVISIALRCPEGWAFMDVVELRIPHKVNIKVYYQNQGAAMVPGKLVLSGAA